jgi:hypothetical protein
MVSEVHVDVSDDDDGRNVWGERERIIKKRVWHFSSGYETH